MVRKWILAYLQMGYIGLAFYQLPGTSKQWFWGPVVWIFGMQLDPAERFVRQLYQNVLEEGKRIVSTLGDRVLTSTLLVLPIYH